MSPPLRAALATLLWCFFHSLFITHRWQRLVRRRLPRWHVFERLVYVTASTVSFAVLVLWVRGLPEQLLWSWDGGWAVVRVLGLAAALACFVLGARAYDGRAFLGLRQVADWAAGRTARPPRFREDGILGAVRHPWYTGVLVLLVFMLPVTDVNLAWRVVFGGYVLVGTELEERKLLAELGDTYAGYRRRVPRFLPRLRRNR
jgi:protein-S-isoprenylcysteine O-methyltransferase Ste14